VKQRTHLVAPKAGSDEGGAASLQKGGNGRAEGGRATCAKCYTSLVPAVMSTTTLVRFESAGEDRQIELSQTGGVGDYVELGDLPTLEGEAGHPEQAAAWSYDKSQLSIDQRRSDEPGSLGRGECPLGSSARRESL